MPSQPYAPGARVGKYEILEHIATGGMGVVYRARDVELGRTVALKVLLEELTSNPAAMERFRREARHAARLSHPNIVTLYEYGQDGDAYYLALEFVDGIDLGAHVKNKVRLDPEEARHIALQAARALDHAFRQGVVHRDVKPSNFLLTQQDGRTFVKLTDLGLARAVREDEYRVTRDGSTVGTVDYLSPEQARDSAAADVRSDIYSLGCTLYHMLAGKPPFSEGGLGERVLKHLQTDPADVRRLNPAVGPGLWAVLRRMLAKNPDDRQQTPAELIHEMQLLSASGLAPSSRAPDAAAAKAKPPLKVEAEEFVAVADTRVLPAQRDMSSDEHRLAAAGQFERAREVLTSGNVEYARHLLLSCCKLDPANLLYRKTLRKSITVPKRLNPVRRWLASFKTLGVRAQLKVAKRSRDHLKVLELGETVLARLPDDLPAQVDMADAAEALGLLPLAVWMMEQAQKDHPNNPAALRPLARRYEKQNQFGEALAVWETLRKVNPLDAEAQRHMNDLAAKETIERGNYQERIAPARRTVDGGMEDL
jgi:tetratricopeptide (TPR) repeat protein